MTYKLYKTINIPFIGSTHIARYCSQGYFFTESVQQSNFSSGLRRTAVNGTSRDNNFGKRLGRSVRIRVFLLI